MKPSRVDEFTATNIGQETRVRLMKINVEGAELSVLKESLPLFNSGRVHALLVELSPSMWDAQGWTMSAAEKLMEKVGV